MAAPEQGISAEWLRIASQDLESARLLLKSESSFVEQVLTLAQQAGEKALKALIAAEGETPPRAHDLEHLLDRVLIRHEPLGGLRDDAALLTRYAVTPRYPDPGIRFTPQEAASAVSAAERLVDAARERLT